MWLCVMCVSARASLLCVCVCGECEGLSTSPATHTRYIIVVETTDRTYGPAKAVLLRLCVLLYDKPHIWVGLLWLLSVSNLLHTPPNRLISLLSPPPIVGYSTVVHIPTFSIILRAMQFSY